MQAVMGSGRDYEPLSIGVFALASSVSAGLALADAAYAAALRGSIDAALLAGALAEVADLLLLGLVFTLLTGFAAVCAAWRWRGPRVLLLAGLVLASGEIWAPWLVPSPLPVSGTVLRCALHGGAVALALLAWLRVQRRQCVIA